MYRGFAPALLATTLLWSPLSTAGERLPVTDPTAPPARAAKDARQDSAAGELLLLHSTHVASSSRSAIINNQIVSIGSNIDGAVVTAIEQGQVTLARGSQSIVLRLLLPPVKRPAKDSE